MCDTKKRCLTCNKSLDTCLFQGLHNCMMCRNLNGIRLEPGRKPNSEYHHNRLKRAYGITLGIYWKIYEQQGGRCAICKVEHPRAPKTNKSLPLVVDHDHETGKVRGLLCNNCNVGLGHFKEQTANFANARSYLRKRR